VLNVSVYVMNKNEILEELDNLKADCISLEETILELYEKIKSDNDE